MNVSDDVLTILARVSMSDEVRRNPDLPLFASGLLDSLATAELLVALSEHFGVEFSPAEFDASTWSTPVQVIAQVQGRVGL